jgi:rod shape-determining protein MreC
MPALNKVRRNGVLLVVLLAANLALMSSSSRDRTGATRLESALIGLASPFVRAGGLVGGGVRSLSGGIHDIVYARAMNRRLRAELRGLSGETVRLRETEHENVRLRQLLGMRQALAPRSIAAQIVAARLDGQTRMFVIDRGRNDGLAGDLPVVAWGGAVGRVVAVGRGHAKVRLLSDANSGVAALVQRSRVQGIVVGRAEDGLDMLYVPRFSDVAHDDRVVTSGLDGIFPRGFGIGRVSAITESPDGSQTIHLEPELDYGSLEEVLVVVEPPARDEPEPER